MKASCCNELTTCFADQNCSCWLQCLGGGGSQSYCKGQCGEAASAATALFFCATSHC
ncbi:MAG: hypothetical protein HY744_14810 [Deltaproteobacteria bacterium]|nr:hypothetical protein [Deltaproteobacteria bacterium]